MYKQKLEKNFSNCYLLQNGEYSGTRIFCVIDKNMDVDKFIERFNGLIYYHLNKKNNRINNEKIEETSNAIYIDKNNYEEYFKELEIELKKQNIIDKMELCESSREWYNKLNKEYEKCGLPTEPLPEHLKDHDLIYKL